MGGGHVVFFVIISPASAAHPPEMFDFSFSFGLVVFETLVIRSSRPLSLDFFCSFVCFEFSLCVVCSFVCLFVMLGRIPCFVLCFSQKGFAN